MIYDKPLSRHWQLSGNNGIAQGADDVDLCIANILATRKGSDVLRPDFGSNHFDYLDTPEDVFVPNVVREVVRAVETWEKRAIVEGVAFEGNAPHLTMIVRWRLAETGDFYQTVVYETR